MVPPSVNIKSIGINDKGVLISLLANGNIDFPYIMRKSCD